MRRIEARNAKQGMQVQYKSAHGVIKEATVIGDPENAHAQAPGAALLIPVRDSERPYFTLYLRPRQRLVWVNDQQ